MIAILLATSLVTACQSARTPINAARSSPRTMQYIDDEFRQIYGNDMDQWSNDRRVIGIRSQEVVEVPQSTKANKEESGEWLNYNRWPLWAVPLAWVVMLAQGIYMLISWMTLLAFSHKRLTLVLVLGLGGICGSFIGFRNGFQNAIDDRISDLETATITDGNPVNDGAVNDALDKLPEISLGLAVAGIALLCAYGIYHKVSENKFMTTMWRIVHAVMITGLCSALPVTTFMQLEETPSLLSGMEDADVTELMTDGDFIIGAVCTGLGLFYALVIAIGIEEIGKCVSEALCNNGGEDGNY